MTKRTKELIREIEDTADALADELAKNPERTPRFRKLWRELKKLVLEGDARFDG